MADCQVGGVPALYHHKARVTVLIKRSRETRFFAQNDALESQKMIVWILEERSIPDSEIEAHHLCELASWNTGTQVDGVAVDTTGVDIGRLDVDDRLVLRITLAARH